MAYSYLGGIYGVVRHENYDEFLRAAGIKEEHIEECYTEVFLVERYSHEDPSYRCGHPGCPHDGLYFTLSPSGRFMYFNNGTLFYDVFMGRIHMRTRYTIKEWEVEQEIDFHVLGRNSRNKKIAKIKMEFTKKDRMIMTITSDFWDGVAKVYYSMHTENVQKMLIKQFPNKRIMSKVSGREVSNGVFVKKGKK